MKFARTKVWKTFMSRLYGWGASLVILGALFKIMHWPFADYALVIGMGVEAMVFFFSAFEHVHEEPDWSLVYPELEGIESDISPESRALRTGAPVTQQNITLSNHLDKLMEEADIGPELINNLGKGLRNLSDNAAKLADVSNATVATNQYIKNMENASQSVLELSQSYKNKSEYIKHDLSLAEEYNSNLKQAVDSMSEMSDAYKQTASNARETLHATEGLTKSLSALNTAYELQMQAASNQSEASKKHHETMNTVVENISASAESAKEYKEEMGKLTENIKSLNSVYGNMLSAMNFNVNR
ncbi:MAG: gliding motility protein GldL [Bacteroidales bacterium]